MNRILIVEPFAPLQEMLCDTLERAGFEILGVLTDANEAESACEQLRPQLLLMNAECEAFSSGIDAARKICAKSAAPKVVLAELFGFKAVTLCAETVASGSFKDIAGLAAVPGYAAVLADLFEGDPFVIVSHDHAKTGGSAFQSLHLHDDRHLDFSALYGLLDFCLTHVSDLCINDR